jgi:hypothetical protein
MLATRVGRWLETLHEPPWSWPMAAFCGPAHLLAGQPSHDAPHLAAPQDRVILFTPRSVVTI